MIKREAKEAIYVKNPPFERPTDIIKRIKILCFKMSRIFLFVL